MEILQLKCKLVEHLDSERNSLKATMNLPQLTQKRTSGVVKVCEVLARVSGWAMGMALPGSVRQPKKLFSLFSQHSKKRTLLFVVPRFLQSALQKWNSARFGTLQKAASGLFWKPQFCKHVILFSSIVVLVAQKTA